MLATLFVRLVLDCDVLYLNSSIDEKRQHISMLMARMQSVRHFSSTTYHFTRAFVPNKQRVFATNHENASKHTLHLNVQVYLKHIEYRCIICPKRFATCKL